MGAVAFMRRLKTHKPFSKRNTLADWHLTMHPLKVMVHFWVMTACKYVPHLGLKNSIYRLTGMKIGRDTAIAPNVMIDFFYPELISIGDNVIIGYGATILAHEFLTDCYKTGEVVIEDNALIGANSTILAGVRIGRGARIGAGSVVSRNVPAGKTYVGMQGKFV